jgi:hypothetical protein
MHSRYRALLFILILIPVILSLMPGRVPALFAAGTASAAEAPDRRTEFDVICSRTAGAQTLNVEEASRLMSRCEALKPRIERLNDSERAIFLKRLKMCRELFLYVLESKEGGTQARPVEARRPTVRS